MKVGIIGLGLMGSSMALAIKKYCHNIDIYGYDKNAEHLSYTLENQVIDKELNEAELSAIDLLFIAVPVQNTIKVICSILPYLDVKKTLITDMGSTKSYLCKTINQQFPDLNFVGGHPMTGRETSGPEYANSDLFIDMTYIITSNENINKEHNSNSNSIIIPVDLKKKEVKLRSVLNEIGANIIFMDPVIHDKIVALTSHLPHFIASTLMLRIIDEEKEYPGIDKLMGQGFRDFTRIAACSPEMWKDIFLTNRNYLLEQINTMIEKMLYFKDAIENESTEEILQILKNTQEKRVLLDDNFKKVRKNEL